MSFDFGGGRGAEEIRVALGQGLGLSERLVTLCYLLAVSLNMASAAGPLNSRRLGSGITDL